MEVVALIPPSSPQAQWPPAVRAHCGPEVAEYRAIGARIGRLFRNDGPDVGGGHGLFRGRREARHLPCLDGDWVDLLYDFLGRRDIGLGLRDADLWLRNIGYRLHLDFRLYLDFF